MGTKTISVTYDAYDILSRNKLVNESFSEEIKRLLKKRKSILDLAGAWSDMPEKEFKAISDAIKSVRKRGGYRL